jgi:hypothetical protein
MTGHDYDIVVTDDYALQDAAFNGIAAIGLSDQSYSEEYTLQ